MRRATLLAGGTVSLISTACGGTFTTGRSDHDAGTTDAGGEGSGGRAAGGRSGTGGHGTGGRIGTGGVIGTGGFAGAGGVATGGVVGAGGATCVLDCSFLDSACNKGVCRGNVCTTTPVPDGIACDDGSLCTNGETCRAGVCTAGSTFACPAPASQCQTSMCDPATGACATKPVTDGRTCEDGNSCTTSDTCKAGVCSGTPPVCGSADGCCPPNCANDPDCGTSSSCTNLALKAVASSSGGGSGSVGPSAMNNGIGKSACDFSWVFNDVTPSGAWIELTWTDAVTIGSIYIETENASPGTPVCSTTATRNIQSGTVQYMSGGVWYDAASFAGFTGDVQVDLPNPVTTTQLRVFDLTATSPGYNSVIFEWHAYPVTGCKPPP